MIEIWKSIENFPYYEVSNFGNVRSVDRVFTDTLGRKVNRKGKLLKCDTNGRYKLVRLYNISQGKDIALLVHRLVAQAFIPNPNNLPCVNHKDENPFNNDFRNLEWCTYKYNSNYGTNPSRHSKKMLDRYNNDQDWKSDCIKRLAEIQKKKRKRVVQLDKFNNYLKTYESSYATEKDGHLSVHVCDCANGKRKTHHGYKWIWECDYLDMIGGALS